MARRPALVALVLLLATSCAARNYTPILQISQASASNSMETFSLLEDYGETIDYIPATLPVSPPKQSVKVKLKTKGPIKNNTLKKRIVIDENVIRATTINIHTQTNFIVTEKPLGVIDKPALASASDKAEEYVLLQTSVSHKTGVTRRPAATPVRYSTKRTTARPRLQATTRRHPTSVKKPSTPRPKQTTVISKTTKKSSSARPKLTSTKTSKDTKKPYIKHSGYISSFFEGSKLKRVPQKPDKSNWSLGILTRIYDWISNPKSTWIPGSSWFVNSQKQVTTTTTVSPLTTTASGWFNNMLNLEEDDNTSSNNDAKQTEKKSSRKTYKGYQLLRAYPDAPWKLQELLEFYDESQGSGILWWTPPSLNSSTDFLVSPDLMEDVKDNLLSSKIQYDIIIRDLQNAIKYENPRLSKKQRLELEKSRGHPMTWRRYHRYADILRYLEYVQHSYADLVELVPLGRSSEGLPLVAVKIALPRNETQIKGTRNRHTKKWKLRSRMKPSVWIDGGAHAREWISPAVVTWMLHALVEGELGLGSDYEMLKQADFYMMPVLNPDGYEHSHTHDRLWSKTRSQQPDSSDDYFGWFPWNWGRTECVGVDTDRNWDFKWGEMDSSDDPCAENYAGPHPFSEPETRAVSEFLTERRGQIKVLLTLHAYSQAWLLPSGHAEATFGDEGELVEMGKLATAAVADLQGTKYKVGTVGEIYQPASGMSHDWASKAGIKFPYHISLPDTMGQYGFLLPGSQIVSTARETWQGVKAIVDNLNP